MKEFRQKLKESAEENQSLACFGVDPVLERIPLKEETEERTISRFYFEIIDACLSENVLPAAFKPNYAFFAQYGFEGLRALKNVIQKMKSTGIPVILDAKRGDIGKTSAAYARECFAFWEADAVTLNPFMGEDSVKPFIEWCEEKGKGVYILNRTSNPGAVDFQNLLVEGMPLYLKVSRRVLDWGVKAKGNLGVVVGAPSLDELTAIAEFFAQAKQPVPFLIPGVGAQGGSAKEVASVLKKAKLDLSLQRINSSSALNYAFEKPGFEASEFASAAVEALKELNQEIGFK